jgi:hypothetical protein
MIPTWIGPPGAETVVVCVSIRRRLIALAKSRRTRRTDFVANMPSRWGPTSITDPRSGCPFTEDGAWEYIISSLEGGAELEEIILEKPPGRSAYVFFLESKFKEKIYVKLQICGDYVRGRSFHYSEIALENFEPRAAGGSHAK